MQPREIWSGGQTGVDRAGWDAARAAGLAINGWVPRGRLAEDGQVPARYGTLMQTASADYLERTTANVRDSDATLILHRGALNGDTAFTHDEAARLGRPVLTVDLASGDRDALAARIGAWLDALPGERLNVAGPRESKAPGIHDEAEALLRVLLADHALPVAYSGLGGRVRSWLAGRAVPVVVLLRRLWESTDTDDEDIDPDEHRAYLLAGIAGLCLLLAESIPEWLWPLRYLLTAVGAVGLFGSVGRLWWLERVRLRAERDAKRLAAGGGPDR